ncbi:hypothetical protein VTL71DRAFT_6091 [Oculimacula yallundae]|uniref:TATA element modulatory factor 1 TATA binding domain-containing protein n=1 Tax=Oculimacula yallundae TaxID=86028 RepID=A0ABR4C119_9HELO
MAAPPKQTSRWGNFLQQAVAGVESRLDNILAEGVEEQAQIQAQQAGQKKSGTAALSASPSKTDGGVSRTASTGNRANDRLQERLARAIAAKNSAQKPERPDSLALSSGVPSRTGSPATVSSSPRQSIDAPVPAQKLEDKDVGQDTISQPSVEDDSGSKAEQVDPPSIAVQPGSPVVEPIAEVQQQPNGLVLVSEAEASPRPSAESTRSSIPRGSIDSARQPSLRPSMEIPSAERPDLGSLGAKTPAEYEAALKQLQSDYETSELQRQEEVHGYIERIDALQSKLQYLAKEGAEAARKASGSAPSGSLEKKLADKEEQVALLMEEGQKLSKKELNQLTTIKKLRAKIQEDSKLIEEAKRKQEVAERDVTIVTERWKRAETFEKRLNDKQKENQQLQKEIETLKSANELKDAALVELEAELDEAVAQGKQAEMKIANEALEAEKKRAAELEDDIANLKIEKNLVADRAQAQIKELREKMEKDLEKARMTELEMKSEQQMLESKLEVMRARAEEVSSGATGDAQAKLLRQIETLQTQYAVASENWQGIETSLLARATNLEKERDEATKREADIRKKAREVTLKAKRNEDELEESRSKMPSFQQELAEHKAKLDTLQQRAEAAEAALIEARASFEQEKQAWKSEMQNRIEEERQKLQEEAQNSGSYSYRAESPVASSRRGLTSEYLGLQNLQIRRASARSINNDTTPTATAGFLARRPSTQPLGKSSGNGTPTRQDSLQSLVTKESQNHNHNHNGADSPSIHTDHDDFFDQTSSPHQTINDLISVSTAAAGPSVQLVERMSSAVRRLESEKVATKEDLARLSAQRDEARAEIVALMREVELKREVEKKKVELESENEALMRRYETTLEMLGEKSERVDELMSDVQDLKAMYRELVESTLK